VGGPHDEEADPAAKNGQAGGLLLTHDGNNTMNHAVAWVAPARDLAILVVTNYGGKAGGQACHEAKDELLKVYWRGGSTRCSA
jgi:hypothetical protein